MCQPHVKLAIYSFNIKQAQCLQPLPQFHPFSWSTYIMERSNHATNDRTDRNELLNSQTDSSSSRLYDDAASSMSMQSKCLSAKGGCVDQFYDEPVKPYPIKPAPEKPRDTCVERAGGEIACGTEIAPETLRNWKIKKDYLNSQKGEVNTMSSGKGFIKLPGIILE